MVDAAFVAFYVADGDMLLPLRLLLLADADADAMEIAERRNTIRR